MYDESEKRPDDRPASEPLPPGTPGEVQPPARTVWAPGRGGQRFAAGDPERKTFWRSSVLAAAICTAMFFVAGLFASAGAGAVQPFVFLLMIAAGGLSVTLYTRKIRTGVLPSKGLKLGLTTGFFGAIFLTLMSMLGLLSRGSRDEFRKMLNDAIG